MLLHSSNHEWKKSVCKKEHMHASKFYKKSSEGKTAKTEADLVNPEQVKSLR